MLAVVDVTGGERVDIHQDHDQFDRIYVTVIYVTVSVSIDLRASASQVVITSTMRKMNITTDMSSASSTRQVNALS